MKCYTNRIRVIFKVWNKFCFPEKKSSMIFEKNKKIQLKKFMDESLRRRGNFRR